MEYLTTEQRNSAKSLTPRMLLGNQLGNQAAFFSYRGARAHTTSCDHFEALWLII